MTTACTTFDVWGSLLQRQVRPEAVKLFTCWVVSLRHADAIHKEWHDARQLLGARQAIEFELSSRSQRDGHGGGFRLHEVLEQVLTRTGVADRLDPAALQHAVLDLVRIEQEQEAFVSGPSPGAREMLERELRAGRRLAFLADYHLPATDVAALLAQHGLAACAGSGLTTADLQARGLSGSLFEVAGRELGFQPGQWRHVGDAAAARRLGADTAGATVCGPSDDSRGNGARAIAEQWEAPAMLPDPERVAAAALCGVPPGDDETTQEMIRIGVDAAPLFAGFALWILEQALRHRSEHIYFFTREGQFLSQVYDAVMQVHGGGVESPPWSVLSVSRLSTFAPSLGELQLQSFADVWAVYTPQSVGGFFATLGIETLCDVDELAMFDLTLDERIENPARDARLGALLAHAPFRDRVLPAIGGMRQRLMAYLASEGLGPSVRRVSTVDVGWHGSIQTNIARLLPDTQLQGLYLGLDRRRSPTGPNFTKSAYVTDLRQSMRHADLVTYVAPMEFLCGAAFGSTVAYTTGQRPVPIRRPVDQETQEAFANVVAPFQEGVIAGARKWAQELRAHGLGSRDVLAEAIATWQRLINYPTEHMAHGFAETTIDETFGFGHSFRLPRDLGMHAPRGFAEEPSSVASYVQDTVRRIPWPQAFAHYARTNRMVKLIVPAAIRAGKRGRHLQSQILDILNKKDKPT